MHAGQRSIFGDTQAGVANPYVPHLHPWPTRYHGQDRTMVDTMPRRSAYRTRHLAVSPHAGLGQGMLPGFTRSALLDAAVGAVLGYLGAPRRDAAPFHALVGAAAVGFGGHLALLGLLGAELFLNRSELPWR